MAGIKALRVITLGKETTAGTAVPTTVIWRGLGTLQDATTVSFVDEDIGYMVGDNRSYISKVEGQLTMDDTPATFEHLPYLFAAGVENIFTGAADTAGSGIIYQYDMATTAAETPKTFTIEAGDNQATEEMAYCFTQQIRLSGAPGEAVMMSADWIGRQVAPTTATTGLTPAVVEEILFGKGNIYIDTIGGTVGTNVKANTLMGFNLTVDTGQRPVYAANAALYYATIKQVSPEVTLSVTFEHDATATAEKAFWKAETARQIQLKFTGSALTTTGGAYGTKTLIVNMAGSWETFDKLGEIDGNDILTGTFRGRYDQANTKNALQVIVVNENASLT